MRIDIKLFLPFFAAVTGAGGANAAVVLTSGAEAAGVHISVASKAVATVDLAPVSGTTPGTYDRKGGVASDSERFKLVDGLFTDTYETFSTGAATTEALATATTARGIATLSDASSTLANQLLSFLPATALGISATAISSTTTAGSANNGLFGTGTSTISGLSLTGSILDGLDLSAGLGTGFAANTRLVTLPGLSIILNEQSQTLTGTSALAMETNAVHILFSDYAINGALLNGDVILGHSQASISGFTPTGAVPEPASWAMMVLGFGAIGAALRRRPGTAMPAFR